MTHRTQLYLDESRYSYLVSLAKQQKTSMAEVIRKLIDTYREQSTPNNPKDDPIYKIIGIVKGGKAPVSVGEHYETYLYGTEAQIRELEEKYGSKKKKRGS